MLEMHPIAAHPQNIGTAIDLVTVNLILSFTASVGLAQTTSTRDTATVYGARLTAKALPAGLDRRRTSNRVINWIDNRLSLRIDRYSPSNTNNSTAAFQTQQTDKLCTASISMTSQRDDQ